MPFGGFGWNAGLRAGGGPGKGSVLQIVGHRWKPPVVLQERQPGAPVSETPRQSSTRCTWRRSPGLNVLQHCPANASTPNTPLFSQVWPNLCSLLREAARGWLEGCEQGKEITSFAALVSESLPQLQPALVGRPEQQDRQQ